MTLRRPVMSMSGNPILRAVALWSALDIERVAAVLPLGRYFPTLTTRPGRAYREVVCSAAAKGIGNPVNGAIVAPVR
jgi:hypothetical protein